MEEKDHNALQENVENKLILASRWRRLWASTLDAIIIAIVAMPAIYFTDGFNNISNATSLSIAYTLLLSIFSIVIFIVLNGKLLINKGQTIGKKALGIKIVTLTGERLSVKEHLLKRYGTLNH